MSRQLTSENAEEAAHGLLRAGLHPEPPEQRLEGYLHLTGLIGACAAVLLVASVVLHWPHSGALEPTTQRDRLHGGWRVHRRSGATATEDVPGELRGAVLGVASAVPPPRTLQLPFIEEVPMLSDQDDGAKPEGGDPLAGDGLEPPQGAPPPADPPGAAAAQRQADAASGGAPELPAGGGPAAGAAVAEGAVEAVSEPRAAASPPEAEAEARAATAPPEPGPLEAGGADGEPPGEACEVFPGWRFGYPGPWSELSIAGVAYGCVVEDWFACLAMCEQELACKQVVFMKLSSTCYATSDPGFEDTDGIGGHNFGFVSAHCRVTTSTSSTTRTRTSSTTTTLTTTTRTRTSTTITTSTSTTTTTTLTTTSRTTSTSTFTETTSTTSTTRTATWTGSLLNAIPSVLGPVVPAATAAAVDSDEWPQGPPGGGSMFCFAVFAPWTVEPALLESQGAARTGIFACDDCAMYSNPAPQIVAGMQVELIDMDMHVPKGGRWNTYLNAPMFSVVWDLVIKDGRWRRHDWVVKADPDSVFFPDRLRSIVMSAEYNMVNEPGSRGVFLNNCYLGLHGPLEVLSRVAVFSLMQRKSAPDAVCSTDEREDVNLMECLLAAGVEQREEVRALAEKDCNRDGHWQSPEWEECTGPEAAFHPFKTVEEHTACVNRALAR